MILEDLNREYDRLVKQRGKVAPDLAGRLEQLIDECRAKMRVAVRGVRDPEK